ncbi:MAG: hypothetical protein GXP61_05270 [Epsilonproteobacteria bacterium]|nr:hypothetical protein [Campylobacterota bacterium]
MKRFFAIGILVATVFLFVTGCAKISVVQNFDNTKYFEKSVSMNKIANAIRLGASSKGWRTSRVKKGLIEASIIVRSKYFVAVNIRYSTYGYKITYKNSRNLKYNPKNNTIHPSYNKWVGLLERNINFELSNIGMDNMSYNEPSNTMPKRKNKKIYKKGAKLNLQGKTIYLKPLVEFSPRSRVARNIKKECTLPKAIADSIVKYSLNSGVNVKFKNHIKPNELELKVQIEEAISAGNAAVGHNKFVVISGNLIKGKTLYYRFDAARLSGGGYWGVYRSSCSVLGRIAKALGNDVAKWLANPYNNAMLGDTQLIRGR